MRVAVLIELTDEERSKLTAYDSWSDDTVIDKCMQRHRHQEWIKFLKEIDARTPPEIDLHLIADPSYR